MIKAHQITEEIGMNDKQTFASRSSMCKGVLCMYCLKNSHGKLFNNQRKFRSLTSDNMDS